MVASKSQIAIWAALLFLGFGLLAWLISWLLTEIFVVTWSHEAVRPWEYPNVFFVIPVALLLASYFFVRRLNHQMLSFLWLYTIIVVTIGLVSATVEESVASMSSFVWWATAFGLASFTVLVGLARRISAESFRHSVLFIVLTVAVPSSVSLIPSQFHTDPSIAPSLPIYITLWIGGILQGILAVWVLANARSVVSATRTVLSPVIAMLLLTAVLVGLSAIGLYEPDSVLDWAVPMLTAGLSSLIAPILAVAVAYAVRVRGRTGSDLQPSVA